MPAAAVIPAPIAYINTAAVKKLVVEFRDLGDRSASRGTYWAPGSNSSFPAGLRFCGGAENVSFSLRAPALN